jgi:hypothetical protein
VFQALIDHSRASLDLKSIRTILGYRRRPRYRRRATRSAEWEVNVEKLAYDLTIFKLHCGKLTLTPTTTPSRSPCRASLMNWASLLDDRQFFCRSFPRSA